MWYRTTGIPNHPLLLPVKLYCLITVSKRAFTHLFMHCLLVKHLVSTSCFSGQGTVPNNKGNTEMRETQPLPVKSFQSQRGHKTTKHVLINKWQNVMCPMLIKIPVLTTHRASLFEETALDTTMIYRIQVWALPLTSFRHLLSHNFSGP